MPIDKKKRRYAEPYRQVGSLIRQAFQMCLKGTTEQELVRMITNRGGSPRVIVKILKQGYDREFRWDVLESRGKIKISNVRIEG